ncbi:hypothetical protein chiPu_0025948, partial [Chiloscyllium punctatum]|nr:hypothetical protein [Chiloscyllium punctatum]
DSDYRATCNPHRRRLQNNLRSPSNRDSNYRTTCDPYQRSDGDYKATCDPHRRQLQSNLRAPSTTITEQPAIPIEQGQQLQNNLRSPLTAITEQPAIPIDGDYRATCDQQRINKFPHSEEESPDLKH